MIKKKLPQSSLVTIAQNKRARHEYFIEKELEAGLSLKGWEVKSLRAGQANINDSYVLIKEGEAYLFGANFQPLTVSSSHEFLDPMRTRKLLLKKQELKSLFGCINCKNYTVIALALYWKKAWIKVKIGIAKGKKEYDKRNNLKEREWQLNKARIIKNMV